MMEEQIKDKHTIKFISRKASLNIYTSSPEKGKKKDKFSTIKQKAQITSVQEKNIKNIISGIRKEKVCQGESLFREATFQNSRQKRDNFLTRYAKDPFMRKKMDLSIKKYSREKPVVIEETSYLLQKKYTTFRQQSQKQTIKTYELINNCKSLMEQLKSKKALKNPETYANNLRSKYYHQH